MRLGFRPDEEVRLGAKAQIRTWVRDNSPDKERISSRNLKEMVSSQKPREGSGFGTTAQMRKKTKTQISTRISLHNPEKRTDICNTKTPYQVRAN